MSILDTFTILFTSNTDQVKDGMAQATQAGKETQDQLNKTGEAGVHAAHEIAEGNSKLSESFDQVREHANVLAETLIEHALEVAAAFKALFEIEKLVDNFFEQAEITEMLGEQAKSLGVNVEEMDAWGQAVTRVGGTADAFNKTLLTLSRGLERAALATGRGQGGISAVFAKLGIDIKDAQGHVKSAFDLLSEIPAKIEKLPKGESAGLLRALRIDPATIRLLQSGNAEIDELLKRQKELGNITEHDTEVAERFERQWKDVRQLFRNITIESDTALLPTLEHLLQAIEEFIEFVRDHKDLVTGFFIAVGIAALALLDIFVGLDAALGILLSPILLITGAVLAAIGLFALAYDDIKGFMEGSRSITGELAKQWPIVGDAVRSFVFVLRWMRDEVVEIFTDILTWIRRIPEGVKQWEDIFGGIGTIVQAALTRIEQLFSTLPSAIRETFANVGVVIKDAFDIIVDIAKFGFVALVGEVRASLQLIGALFHLVTDFIVDPEHAFQHFWETVKSIIADFVKTLPQMTDAFDEVDKAIHRIGDDIIAVFKHVWEAIGWIIDKIGGAAKAVSGVLGNATGVTGPGSFDEYGRPIAPAPSASPSGALGSPAMPVPIGRRVGLLPGQLGAAMAANAAANENTPGSTLYGTLPDEISAGQAALAATQTSLMAQTSNSLSTAKTVENNISVTTGPITVNTQATDAAGTAAALSDALQEHYTQVMPNFATGIAN